MSGLLAVFDVARFALGALLIVLGLAFMAGGAIGRLRFPDFYTRLHAAGVSDAVGAVIVLVGLAFVAGDGATALRVLLLAALIAAVSPVIAHMTANAAHAGGLAPLAGPYTAPRPGKDARR